MFVGYVELYTMLQYVRYGYTKKKKQTNKRSDFLVTQNLALDNIPLVFEIFVPTNLAIDKRVNNMH